jgi:hypothetical protein
MKSQSSRNQGFSSYFCLVIEGSGSGSRRPKNMWIGGSGSESVCNIIQGVLLRHPIHTISYTIPPPASKPSSKKETPRWTVLYSITRQLLYLHIFHNLS